MSTPTTDYLIRAFQAIITEIEKLNSRITSAKNLKENNSTNSDQLDTLIEQYAIAKAELVKKHSHLFQELQDAIQAKEMALNRQTSKSSAMLAELIVEENIDEDKHKVEALKAGLTDTQHIVTRLRQEHCLLEGLRKDFLAVVLDPTEVTN